MQNITLKFSLCSIPESIIFSNNLDTMRAVMVMKEAAIVREVPFYKESI